MKAWFVWYGDEWGEYVHGETASKAKSMFMREWSCECDWIDLRPIRCSALDNIPITSDSIRDLHSPDTVADEHLYPICKCEICDV